MKTQNKSMGFFIFRGKVLFSWYKEIGTMLL